MLQDPDRPIQPSPPPPAPPPRLVVTPAPRAVPASVMAVVVLTYIGAGLALCGTLLVTPAVLNANSYRAQVTANVPAAVTAQGRLIGFAVLALSFALCGLIIWVARRLQQGTRWARTVTIVMYSLGIAGGVVQALAGGYLNCLSLILMVVCLGLLGTREARAYFGLPNP